MITMRKQMSKSLLGILIIVLVLALAACGQDVPDSTQGGNTTEQPDQNQTAEQNDDQSNGSNHEETTGQSQDVTVFYVDEELLNLLEEEQTIQFSSEQEKWSAVWKALQTPQQEDHVSLWANVELLDAELEEGTLTLNISKPENSQVGSSGEGFAIQAVLNTYGQLEGVEAIQFTVEGQVIESLYGHVGIDQPLKTDEKIMQ